ncbi:MAG: hypothetical protein ACYC5K_13890 [Saccharofermentanales bacterium]
MNKKEPSPLAEIYQLPYSAHSGYKIGMHLMFFLMEALFIGFSFIPPPGSGLGGIIYRGSCILIALFFAYIWGYIGLLKKATIELSHDGISIQLPFYYKKLKWSEISDVQTYYSSHNSYIGITSKARQVEIQNSSHKFLEVLKGLFTISIPLRSFQAADPEKLFATIVSQANASRVHEADEEARNKPLNNVADQPVNDKGPVIALLKAFLFAVGSGVLYGFIFYFLKENGAILPIFGCVGIFSIFMKNYNERNSNIFIRLLLGAICALPVPMGVIFQAILFNSYFFRLRITPFIIEESFRFIAKFHEKYDFFIIVGIVCFLSGLLMEYSSKMTRKIRKLFMKKQNGFCIRRENRYISIYLTDYAEYDEFEGKDIFGIEPNRCLVEKIGKGIRAFYIPEEIFIENGLDTFGFENTILNEKIFYKIDLGGGQDKQFYGYSCMLFINADSHVEMIRLETD